MENNLDGDAAWFSSCSIHNATWTEHNKDGNLALRRTDIQSDMTGSFAKVENNLDGNAAWFSSCSKNDNIRNATGTEHNKDDNIRHATGAENNKDDNIRDATGTEYNNQIKIVSHHQGEI